MAAFAIVELAIPPSLDAGDFRTTVDLEFTADELPPG